MSSVITWAFSDEASDALVTDHLKAQSGHFLIGVFHDIELWEPDEVSHKQNFYNSTQKANSNLKTN